MRNSYSIYNHVDCMCCDNYHHMEQIMNDASSSDKEGLPTSTESSERQPGGLFKQGTRGGISLPPSARRTLLPGPNQAHDEGPVPPMLGGPKISVLPRLSESIANVRKEGLAQVGFMDVHVMRNLITENIRKHEDEVRSTIHTILKEMAMGRKMRLNLLKFLEEKNQDLISDI